EPRPLSRVTWPRRGRRCPPDSSPPARLFPGRRNPRSATLEHQCPLILSVGTIPFQGREPPAGRRLPPGPRPGKISVSATWMSWLCLRTALALRIYGSALASSRDNPHERLLWTLTAVSGP